MIAHAIAQLRQTCGVPVAPHVRGPVLLQRFFEEQNLEAVALPQLTCAQVRDYLLAQGLHVEPFGEPDTPLAGFLFFTGKIGFAFVNRDEILPRRRFTAAHELGHAVLHRGQMARYIADTPTTLFDSDAALTEMEREANRFAAELLMPEEICRQRAAELQQQHGVCPRVVLTYRLASELLVSREALRIRLKTLELGDDE